MLVQQPITKSEILGVFRLTTEECFLTLTKNLGKFRVEPGPNTQPWENSGFSSSLQ